MTARDRSPWIATPLVAVATFLGIYGLGVMIEIGAWLTDVALVLAVAVVASALTRLASRSRALPTLIAAIASVVAMVPLFAVTEDGEARLLPTPDALRDLGAAIRGGVDYAAQTVAPAPPDPSFTALIAAGVLALFLVADHLAVSWRAAATAGLLLLVPWMPAVIFQHRVSATALICAIAAWLATLALTRRPSGVEGRPGLGGAVTATTAALAGVLLVAPTALGGLGWGMIPRIDAPSGLDTSTRLNLALDLRTSLTANSTSPVLVYETTGDRPDSFRLYTLTDFDGVQWAREATETPVQPAAGRPLWTAPIDDWDGRERSRIEMQVLDLTETNLPLPPTPRSVEIEGDWFYDAERDEVVGEGVTARDVRYSMVTDTQFHQEEELEAAQAQIDEGAAPEDPRYLDISPAIDSGRVQTLAREVTAGTSSRYEQALALQGYLRNASEFTYDTSVDPTGGDAISTFLDDREGYCVQFATTMVMMARSLGIPARMAVGFLSGSATDQGTWVVQGGDAHAWPEVWFPGEGWVRFEPTPAIQSGMPPAYADPYANGSSTPQDLTPGMIPDAVPGEPVAPDGSPAGPGMPAPTETAEEPFPVWAWAGIGAVLVIAVAAAIWWWSRRGAVRVSRLHGTEAEWESLRRRLPPSVRWSAALTPHEAAEHVVETMRSAGPGLTGHATESMTRLAHAVADHRYAPAGSASEVQHLRTWADAVLTEATADSQPAGQGKATRGKAMAEQDSRRSGSTWDGR
ncbi:transglutaminaseTgpA domain-containing protein [Demequina sp. SO4-13]|uniref:transglutaminase family protein n=1 Tax=Demequina sp. SO4-13 TaxID=3401027 RepID=UPI003AF41562